MEVDKTTAEQLISDVGLMMVLPNVITFDDSLFVCYISAAVHTIKQAVEVIEIEKRRRSEIGDRDRSLSSACASKCWVVLDTRCLY